MRKYVLLVAAVCAAVGVWGNPQSSKLNQQLDQEGKQLNQGTLFPDVKKSHIPPITYPLYGGDDDD